MKFEIPHRDVPTPLAVLCILWLLAVSCAARTDPDVEALRTTYLRTSSDWTVRENAAQDLSAADATIRQAEEIVAKGGDRREVDHLVYMARRRLELAQTRAAYAQARAEIQRGTTAPDTALPGTTTVREDSGGLAPTHEIDRAVTITQRSTLDGTVTGQVTNRSPSAIRNIEMQIRYEWLWADEMKPGDYSPGRTDRFELPDRIAPGQTASFVYTPAVPLPQRDDGHFEVSVRPVGFVEIPN
jgi:hypothetical protein